MYWQYTAPEPSPTRQPHQDLHLLQNVLLLLIYFYPRYDT